VGNDEDTDDSLSGIGGNELRTARPVVNALLHTHRNQADLLIGFTFWLTSGARWSEHCQNA
jgi:hypothetical protein